MKTIIFTTVICGIASLGGCTSNDPKERAADAIESNASAQASEIKATAAQRAEVLQNQSSQLATEADKAGGYQGQTLNVRADALKKESHIVKAQASAQADAVKAAGDAQAKAIRSQ
ncbi:hypothetical protein D3Y57_10065 [Sphingomonas paeninsulae]|jgi:hypothetical protein|uniref:Lipoprotein n=1 Tax=Sphingomonas paeninsulae TaxID=2319844 RepID=A0A494TK93_SPHPE|nr:hypothetical protein [Sphingomonas paeninsulae]AYJ86246.1 hypothetical protein D3Y57_10065 [Sphingomonas paeninsulae]